MLKYLQKTKHYCLKYCTDNNIELKGFVDADWVSDILDRKSTGFCFAMAGSVISWKSRKQKTVSLSSTEAEYVALSEAAREDIYLRNLLYELTGKLNIVKLHCDNQSAMKLAKNDQSLSRTKHIDVRYHYVKDAIEYNLIDVQQCCTEGLLSTKHYKFLELIGLVPN